MEDSQNFERQLYQFKYLKEQVEMLQGQLEIVNASLSNLRNTKSTLENIKDGVNKDDEVLVPIGGLVNIRASIKDTEKVLLYINQDIVIEKNVVESIEFIDKLISQHNDQIKFLTERIQLYDLNLQGMSQELQNRMGQRTS
ncbi:MAG: prefoldin subunit alpha [Promethearchaeota archaeon]|nr:MAG: prefoldin subunit alpha [Candidatus Lokiarchaeota archaeon]